MLERLYRRPPIHKIARAVANAISPTGPLCKAIARMPSHRVNTDRRARAWAARGSKRLAPEVESVNGARRPQRSGRVYRALRGRGDTTRREDGLSRRRLLAGWRSRWRLRGVKDRILPHGRERDPHLWRWYNPGEHPRLRRARGGRRQDDRRFDQEPSLQPDFRDAGRIWGGGARVCALPRAGVGRRRLCPPVTPPRGPSPIWSRCLRYEALNQRYQPPKEASSEIPTCGRRVRARCV